MCNHSVSQLPGPGFGEVIHHGWVATMVAGNGSYIMENGCIVLVPEDVESYFNGTLVFYDVNQELEVA